jgi:glyoxylase I family protein
MANRTLDHASIRVSDLDRSRAFYEGLLGLDRAPRPELGFPGVWYDLGGSQIHLIAHEKMMDGIDPTDPHMAIAVESLATVKQELEARGIKYVAFGGSQLWIRDPDGNTVELCERR